MFRNFDPTNFLGNFNTHTQLLPTLCFAYPLILRKFQLFLYSAYKNFVQHFFLYEKCLIILVIGEGVSRQIKELRLWGEGMFSKYLLLVSEISEQYL